MNLEKLYKMQEELDNNILENARERNVVMSKEELLDKTILALLVEVGELANATRCFKHWSLKGSESKERILDELADIWHFYLSIGNQKGVNIKYEADLTISKHYNDTVKTFGSIYFWISKLNYDLGLNNFVTLDYYRNLGSWIKILWHKLGFTDKEVERAYLKKHEENYRRQREGY